MKQENKVLVIVDMQNDFIDGSLANKDAEAIVPGICKLVKQWKGPIICTKDTHYENYLDTQEGKNLPIKHCIKNSEGWEVNSQIMEALKERDAAFSKGSLNRTTFVEKGSFGYKGWGQISVFNYIGAESEVVFVGTCTDICVISNVLNFKTEYPYIPVTVYGNLCAGLTREKHAAALDVMQSCQVNVIHYGE